MKAFCVFPYPHPAVTGCVLIWAKNRGAARAMGECFFLESFIELGAWRSPEFDKYYSGNNFITSNAELPEGAPPFFVDPEKVI